MPARTGPASALKHRSRPRSERDVIGTRFASPDLSPGFVLWQVATVWQREIRDALADLELTHAQFVLLASVGWLEGHA
ncbi:MAG TPA: hypothetical protein VGC84_04425, partial [Ilumatobacteraceae bacterium]